MSLDESKSAAELERLALISHSGSGLAQIGPQVAWTLMDNGKQSGKLFP